MNNHKIISFEVPEDLRKLVKKAAFESDMTVSAYIRFILEKELVKK